MGSLKQLLGHRWIRRPGMVVVVGFAAAIVVFTLLLMLPAAREAGEHTTFRQALFTATSAVCVTGLTVVDTHPRTGRPSAK
jgi:trk system potassium uptake protein